VTVLPVGRGAVREAADLILSGRAAGGFSDVPNRETVEKPWGFYKVTAHDGFYQSKVLTLLPRASISLQRHKLREEYWIVVFGSGEARVGDSTIGLSPGSVVSVPRNCLHRLRNTDGTEPLIVVEVQLGTCFDESDIERIDDVYGRVDRS
jgi:mannose-6-phosphate isomerase-like protein (cupin superfamily)